MWKSLVWMLVGFKQVFCYYSVIWFLSNHKWFEVQCLGYPLVNFQVLTISSFPCRCDNILVSFLWKIIHHYFCEKSFITLQILLVFKQKLVQDVPYISFNQCVPNLCIFMAVFCKCVKRRTIIKRMKKMSDFLKAHISGMAGAIYFRSSMCFLLICSVVCQHFDSNCMFY